jgi:hypothetical protein
MTGTELHAPRGSAGRGGTQLAQLAVRGPRQSCTALYDAVPPAVGPTGTTGSELALGATRRRMRILAPGPLGDSGPQAGRRNCVTWSGHTDVDLTQ